MYKLERQGIFPFIIIIYIINKLSLFHKQYIIFTKFCNLNYIYIIYNNWLLNFNFSINIFMYTISLVIIYQNTKNNIYK